MRSFLAFAACLSSSIAHAQSCSEWDFTSDGGYPGSLPEAYTYCNYATDKEYSLHFLCIGHHFSLRYVSFSDPAPQDTINGYYELDFVSSRDMQLSLFGRDEDADGAWAWYTPSFQVDHPLIEELSAASTISVSERYSDTSRIIELSGSRKAIERVLAECGES